MKRSLLPLFIFISLQCFGQTNERLWEDGPLTWEDFKGEPFMASPNASELNYHLSYAFEKKKTGDTAIYNLEARNYMNPDISWVKAPNKSDQLLRYNQVLFNILELHRRKLQSQLHRVDNSIQAEQKFKTQYEICNKEIGQFQDDTQLGTAVSALDYWDQRITAELQDNPFELLPEIRYRPFGIGLNVGMGTGIFTETISDFFTPGFNVMYGFDVAYKRTLFLLHGTLGGSRVKHEYLEDGMLWPKDLKTNVAIIELSLGQAIIDNAKHKLTPFAGLGLIEFTVADREGEVYEDYRIANNGLIYGLNYDFKFRKGLRLAALSTDKAYRERNEQNIRVRLYLTGAEFENMKGTAINWTVGFSWFGRKVDVK